MLIEPAVLYLHGFRSSPASTKARQCQDWLSQRGFVVDCPALDISPAKAMAQARACVDLRLQEGRRVCLIGSSLGGYYATYLMEAHPAAASLRAVLLNPAARADRDLHSAVGHHPAWHSGEMLEFKASYLDELAAMRVQPGTAGPMSRYQLVAAAGDEVLDAQEMKAYYAGAELVWVGKEQPGSNHSLDDFVSQWPAVLDFMTR